MLLLLLALLPLVTAGPEEDAARLGQYYTNIAIYRSGSGNNVVTVGVGEPAQEVNLTLSTNVDFILVASSDCDNCVSGAERYDSSDSRSVTTSQRALSASLIYPTSDGSVDTLTLNGNFVTEQITDPREDSYDRVLGVINEIEEVIEVGQGGRAATLPDGISGFFGLGVYQEQKDWSIIPSLMQVNGRGAPSGVTSYTVGIDMAPYTRDPGVQAGNLHFGGVPVGAYVGNFNWMDANVTAAGSWGVEVNRVRVEGNVLDTERYYGSLDPAFDSIYVPAELAEDIFSGVTDATQDGTDPTRWNVPCDATISMTVTIANREYKVDSSQLVQQRGVSPNSCWSSIVAWQAGSVPDIQGEIRLGTPFLAGVYAALYYAERQQLVGLAGKPDTVNDANLYSRDRGEANGRLAGILIGSLLAGLIILLLLCYGRNRNSFQSIWYRSVRRQHRAQVNALVRAATIPPPVIGAGGVVVPPPGPMMAGVAPMGSMGPMGPMGPSYMPVPVPPNSHMGYGGWQAPPMYQPPMQPPQPQPQQHQQGQYAGQYQHQGQGQPPLPINAPPPPSVQHQPHGFYSPRHHSLPAQLSHAAGPSPKPPRYSQPPLAFVPQHPPEMTQSHSGGNFATMPSGLGRSQSTRHASLSPGKVHFGGAPPPAPAPSASGGRMDEEPSMVQRDRAKVAEERRLDEAIARNRERLGQPHHPLPPHQQPPASRSKGRGSQRLYLPHHSPTPSEKKRWWQNLRNLDPEYSAVKADPPPPHSGQTGEAKSIFSDRGWRRWTRHEREADRRASRMGGGQWYQ